MPRAHSLGASLPPPCPYPTMIPIISLSPSLLLTGPSAGCSSVRFSRRPTCPDASVAGSLPTPPVPRHRKSHSLGNKWVIMNGPPRASSGQRLGLEENGAPTLLGSHLLVGAPGVVPSWGCAPETGGAQWWGGGSTAQELLQASPLREGQGDSRQPGIVALFFPPTICLNKTTSPIHCALRARPLGCWLPRDSSEESQPQRVGDSF